MKIEAETDSNSFMSVRVFGDGGKDVLDDEKEGYETRIKELENEKKELVKKIRIFEEKRLTKDQKLNEIKLELEGLNKHINSRVYDVENINEDGFNRAKSWYNKLIYSWGKIDSDYESILDIKILDDTFTPNTQNVIEFERLTAQMKAKLNGRIDSLIGDKLGKTVENLEKEIVDIDSRLDEAEQNIKFYMRNLQGKMIR